MYYAKPNGESPIYQTNIRGEIEYDDDGNPIETGETKPNYEEAVSFRGVIKSQLENAIMRAWGSDNSNNYAVLILSKNAVDKNGNALDFPIGTRIWKKNTVRYIDGEVDGSSANYIVSGILDESQDETDYYLTKLDGSES